MLFLLFMFLDLDSILVGGSSILSNNPFETKNINN